MQLRTSFGAASAGHAEGYGIDDLLFCLGEGRTESCGVIAIDFNPSLYLLEVLKHDAAIDDKVADEGEFCEGSEGDD